MAKRVECAGSYLATEEHFERFRKEILRLADEFGTHDWDYRFEFVRMKEAQGQYYFDYEHRYVLFSYHKGYLDTSPEVIARHEFVEGVLLGRMKEMGMEKCFTEQDVTAEAHRIVHLMVNYLGLIDKERKEYEKIKSVVTVIDLDDMSMGGVDLP